MRAVNLPFESFERITTARSGVVCTSQPLASEAGLAVLRSGGNAVDAAVAAAAVLAVVEPAASQLGGDVFMIVRTADGGTHALNGSGRAPREVTPESFPDGIPLRGPLAATVPGAVHGWCEAASRWGTKPLSELLAAAIHYARGGFAIGTRFASELRVQREMLSRFKYSEAQYLGVEPEPGSVLRQPELGLTLEAIASNGAAGFYEGEVAREMVRAIREQGGVLSEADLAEHRSQLLEPIRSSYRGYEVLEQPPVSQGHILLQELNIAEQFDLAAMGPLSADAIHVLIEAKKLAFADRDAYLGDPEHGEIPMDWLLSKEYAAERAGMIDVRRAGQPAAGKPRAWASDTTYLAAADSQGNAVSWIQSVFHRFGSGVVAGNTGVLLNNRMNGFVLEPGHPNTLAPLKKPAHTLNTYMLFRDGRPWLVGGTPGAHYQVQTNLQIVTNIIDFDMNVAEANDAPWWTSNEGLEVVMENRVPAEAVAGLRERGHDVTLIGGWKGGRTVQLIQLLPDGTMLASSDVRAEGHAAAW